MSEALELLKAQAAIVGLNRLGTAPRYPSKIELSGADARRAVNYASKIRVAITAVIVPLLSDLGE